MARRQGSGRRHTGGVTLVEQVMVVAILAVLVGIASPSLARLVRHGRAQTAQMDFIEALGFARSTAILQRTRVLFCPTRDGMHCSDESRWDKGWLVAIDHDRDKQPDAAPLRVGVSHPRLVIRSSASRRHVTFLPDGTAGGSNLTLLVCQPDNGGEPLGVVVSNTGRVRGSRPRGTQAGICS